MSNALDIDQTVIGTRPTRALAAVFLIGASILAVYLHTALSTVHFWWLDELFSLWASQPNQPFGDIFTERIAPDTNPPLYFSALYFVRQFITDDRTAVVVLNVLALIISALVVLVVSVRRGRPALAMIGVGLFLLSGPVLRYTLEARTYLFAIAIVFVAAWVVALKVTASPAQARKSARDPQIFSAGLIALGILAAFVHVYAALACGALGAGLIGAGLQDDRRDLIRAGFQFGCAATLGLIAWILLFAPGSGSEDRIDWLKFSLETIVEAAWDPKILVAGSLWVVGLIAVLSVYALVTQATRTLALTFAIAAALFVAVPIGVSIYQPILHGRYWTIGAPLILVFLLFAAERWWQSSSPNTLAAAAAASVFFVASCVFGYTGARTLHIQVWPWTGASIVAAQAQSCAPGTIAVRAVKVGPFGDFTWGFPKVSGVPEATFRNSGTNKPGSRSDTTCPVLGWSEHIWIAGMTDRALLDRLSLDVAVSDVDIRRHGSGYVVLRRRP